MSDCGKKRFQTLPMDRTKFASDAEELAAFEALKRRLRDLIGRTPSQLARRQLCGSAGSIDLAGRSAVF
jgi:hypothetical protein